MEQENLKKLAYLLGGGLNHKQIEVTEDWVTDCPVCDDGINSSYSLNLTDNGSGKAVCTCVKGCSESEVLKKVKERGLTYLLKLKTEGESEEGSKKPKAATREQYFQLFEQVFKKPRRCIFNEKLMNFEKSQNLWNPCINSLDLVKSEALLHNETNKKYKYALSNIQPHFFAFEAAKPLEFLVDIPQWDGQERIARMADLITLKESAGVTKERFADLLKEWCAKTFQRLEDPMIQNKIFVLKGGQGVGKDTWTSMLVDGLGQFAIPLSVIKEDKDTYLNLHRGLVMKISEFDKTAKTEVSTLKDIITTPSTNLRAPYDRDSKVRHARCSFISSANAENLLRDSTGNRRFWIFEVESIEYGYQGWDRARIYKWQIDILAEMRYLALNNFEAPIEAHKAIKDYIEQETPEDIADFLVNQFLRLYYKDPANIARQFWADDDVIMQIAEVLARNNGMKPKGVIRILCRELGEFVRLGAKRKFRLTIPAADKELEQIKRIQLQQDSQIPF